VVSNFGYVGSRDGRLERGDIETGGCAGLLLRRRHRQTATCVGLGFVGLPGWVRQRMGGGRNAETRGVAAFGGLRLLRERASLKLVSWLCGEAEEATAKRTERSVGEDVVVQARWRWSTTAVASGKVESGRVVGREQAEMGAVGGC
jgi:hypothetical protein